MATYTPNLNLSKPENTDSQQSFISDYCDNMDILDTAISGNVYTAGDGIDITSNVISVDASNKTTTSEFTTANGGLLSKCIINLEPIQSGSGNPSPDNVRPFSGHTEVKLLREGKNIWGGAVTIQNIFANAFPLSVTSGKVTLSLKNASGKQINGRGYDEDRNIIIPTFKILDSTETSGSYTLTLTEKTYFNIIISNGSASDIPKVTEVQIEKGEQATPYEPYLGHLYQVQIGSTVYGGYVDLVSGVMTITHAIVDMGSLSWTYYSDRKYFDTGIEGMKLSTSESDLNDTICEGYKFGGFSYDSSLGNKPNGTYWVKNSNHVRFKDSRFTDATNFTNAVNGMELCYELATPQTIQLTPQQIEALPKENNLSTPLEGQSIDSVKYREVFVFDDVEKVVNLRVPISMLGTDESGRTTASQSYASGDYFYKDGYMCKALTSISAGATLTLNTNYSQGTLADVLKAIENA